MKMNQVHDGEDCVCRRCQGSGYEVFDEDDRRVESVCYHCGGSGLVDERVDNSDRLYEVAATLGYNEEKAYRKFCDEDPLGDGYELRAAENQMTTADYFKCRVWERQAEIAQELLELDPATQAVLIAWNEYEG